MDPNAADHEAGNPRAGRRPTVAEYSQRRPDYLLAVRGDSIDRTELQGGEVSLKHRCRRHDRREAPAPKTPPRQPDQDGDDS